MKDIPEKIFPPLFFSGIVVINKVHLTPFLPPFTFLKLFNDPFKILYKSKKGYL